MHYSFAVFMPVLETELGWSRGEMSGAFALATLLSGVFAAPVGRRLDFRGPRLLMSAGSIAAVLLVVAWSQVTSLVQFYLLWALIGMTMATVLYEPAFAVVTAWFERQRTRALADELGMRPVAAHCHLGLGKLYARSGKRAQAQEASHHRRHAVPRDAHAFPAEARRCGTRLNGFVVERRRGAVVRNAFGRA